MSQFGWSPKTGTRCRQFGWLHAAAKRSCPLLQEAFANSRNRLCASIGEHWLISFAYHPSLGSAIAQAMNAPHES
jgi:hypothetical protein